MPKNRYSCWVLNLRLKLSLVIGGVANCVSLVLFNTLPQNIALAQIVPDQTLGGESSLLNPDVDLEGTLSDKIEGGAIRGSNLFHSFKEFNVREGQGAYFVNPVGIEHIISRVTGNNVSQILGNLGVLGNADLFLVNPNGIVFGPSAALDLKGSFIATTANSLIFEDGTQFSATETSVPPLLTVSIPASLQFRESAGNIINQSQALSIDGDEVVFGLGVKPNKTLGLVGGNIILQGGGSILAPQARIELGSVGGTSQVRLQPIDSGWALSYEGVQHFQDIQLTQFPTIVSTTGIELRGGGHIKVQGRNIFIKNGSQFFGSGADIILSASETVLVSGIGSGFPSAISSESPLIGNEGNVIINSKKLIVQNGGRITSATSGLRTGENFEQLTTTTVSGGNLIINASESVQLKEGETLSGVGGDIKTGLFSSTASFGAAGNIIINTGKLTVQDGAIISAETTGVDALNRTLTTGQAGNININAQTLSLKQGLITAETRNSEGDEGANINLQVSDLLTMENESLISATANGLADGGNINIDTPFLVAFPPTGPNGSDIIAKAEQGNGGRIAINAQGIFGIEENLATPGNRSNDLDASSEAGASGEVVLNRELDPNRGLVRLPENVIDPNALIAQNACKQGSESEFVITGRGGLPSGLNSELNSEATQIELVEPAPINTTRPDNQAIPENDEISRSTKQPIIPAQGWVFNEKGEIVLVSYNPTITGPQRLPEHDEKCSY